MKKSRFLLVSVGTGVAIAAAVWFSATPARKAPVSRAQNILKGLPVAFEANQGQVDPQVKYLAKGSGFRLFLTQDEAVVSLLKQAAPENAADSHTFKPAQFSKNRKNEETVVRVRLAGANHQAEVQGQHELPGHVNYLIGRDSSRWHRGVPMFAEVSYRGIYPGIDVVYHGSDQHRLEYDFVVAPNANPNSIRMAISGGDKLSVNGNGDLLIAAGSSELTEHRPIAYQTIDGQRKLVEARYTISGNDVAIKLGAYDRNREVVIDPTITYESYLGGDGADNATGLFQDSSGNIFLAGSTASTNFPTSSGAFQTALSGTRDAFVTKLAPGGSSIVFSTYLGGNATTDGMALAVDVNDIPTVVGTTTSDDFPVVNGIQPALSGPSDGFFAQLNPDDGSALLLSSYIGGTGDDCVNGVAVNSSANLFLAGITSSSNFPVTEGAIQTTFGGGTSDGFFSQVGTSVVSLVDSTYLGGTGADSANGIAVDANGGAYLTGRTASSNFPVTTGAFQTTLAGTQNAFVSKVASDGTLGFSTFLGGSSSDEGNGIALTPDSPPEIAITGNTDSTDFPTHTPTQAAIGGGVDAFVSEFDNTGARLLFSTFLGGADLDSGNAIQFASTFEDVVVTGLTSSDNFPTKSAFQNSLSGTQDAFLTDINMAKPIIDSSSYFGGNGVTDGAALFLNSDATAALFAGFTNSDNLNTTSDAFQKTYGGGNSDAFLVGVKFTKEEQTSQSSHGPNLTTTMVGLSLIGLWIVGVMIRRRRAAEV